MLSNCAYCSGVILSNEDRWKVGEASLHITPRPGANPDDPHDTCYWAYKHSKRLSEWPNTVFRIEFRRPVCAT